MLAAVEAVTSMSLWQLALFNARSHEGGGGEGRFWRKQTFIGLPAMSHVHMSNAYYQSMGYRPSTKSIIPREPLCACVC